MTEKQQTVGACLWCDATYMLRRSGGSPHRFCSVACRMSYHRGLRDWAAMEIEKRKLPIKILKQVSQQRTRCKQEASRLTPVTGAPRILESN